ncbi:MAG: pyruvate, phosphate dikinase [Negativicutes bacterium]|jgi:pyruvate,orthophosphate dikinase
MSKFVYLFREGNKDMKPLLGGKGANLAEMTNIGLPVPPGFTITTDVCREYYKNGAKMPDGVMTQVAAALADVEKQLGKKFGDAVDPLLLSVRSGSVFSMPGMMDTVLNLGINDTTVEAIAKKSGNRWFALDSFRRFIQMFSDVVLGVSKHDLEHVLADIKKREKAKFDQDLSESAMMDVITAYKKYVFDRTGRSFPNDPMEQLGLSIEAVFSSWNNERAVVYRNLNKIDHNLGTAVSVQSMVFGNMGNDCGTGVAFTRNPSNGENLLYGEYLFNAQGEDVVAGVRTPKKISELHDEMPEIYDQFAAICKKLENYYKNVQDIEFTIEKNKLFILQTRNGKRTAPAAVKIAHDLCIEGVVTKRESMLLVDAVQLDQLLHPQIDGSVKVEVLGTGLPASPGAACGKVVFSADAAAEAAEKGIKTLLVSTETTPDDIHGMHAAEGILTCRGGMTSHAAVVARGMGKPCVCGCEALSINFEAQTLSIGGSTIKAGDMMSIDGTAGRVIKGEIIVKDAELSPECVELLSWADEIKQLDVRANADTPEDAIKSREFGAKGIGLTRTEHMFMGADRLPHVQSMILAEDFEARAAALAILLPMQESDFYGILKAMDGYPVCIRLLDPPLHEFLPNREELMVEIAIARETGKNADKLAVWEKLWNKVDHLHEFNPMLGHRGCRLGISWPEIYEMQIRAIFNATARLTKEGFKPHPEVEIPLTIDANEMRFFKERIDRIAAEVKQQFGTGFHYTSGTMIEIPRAALMAGELAEFAEFFSFGTNDLTQTTLGFSRDDAEGKFLKDYLEKKILKENPFIVLDRKGVGQLMKIACENGKKTRPNLIVGICGEHGGEPSSIQFCNDIGLDFISCSPFRVPIARLAAAQAVVAEGKEILGTR